MHPNLLSVRNAILLLCFLLICSAPLFAQDTLHVFHDKAGWNLHHKVRKGETIYGLARQYKMLPATMAASNGLTVNDLLRDGMTVTVPLGNFNLTSTAPRSKATGRALVYVVRQGEDLSYVSSQAAVSKTVLQQWNRLRGEQVFIGQRLFVGWVAIDTSIVMPRPESAIQGKPPVGTPKYTYGNDSVRIMEDEAGMGLNDTVAVPVLSPGETEFMSQTSEGANVVTERGAAVLFSSGLKPANGIFNGFFNGAQRGAIIEVRNLNNGRKIWVKVLGPVPATNQYHNAAMGISSAAKSALGVTDNRTLCEFRFAGY